MASDFVQRMTRPGRPRAAVLLLTGLMLGTAAVAQSAPGEPRSKELRLGDLWPRVLGGDRTLAIARADAEVANARKAQADALWRPVVSARGVVGLGSGDSRTTGASFSAPGFGTSTGVNFATSIDHGVATRLSIQALLPLYDRDLDAQRKLLMIGAQGADAGWQAGVGETMLRAVERYFALGLAQDSARLIDAQLRSVQRSAAEAQDRFRIGSAPVTAVHEAQAALAALRAQRAANEFDIQVRRQMLADSIGLEPAKADGLSAAVPAPAFDPGAWAGGASGGSGGGGGGDDESAWIDRALAANPRLAQLRLAIDAAEQELRRYDGAISPSVAAVAMASRDRLSGSGDFGEATQRAGQALIGVQLTLPLYTGGMREARREEARQLLNKAQAQHAEARQGIALQVRQAWLALRAEEARWAALVQAERASVARLDATRIGLKAGDRTTLDVLNAENDLGQHRRTLAQARVAWVTQRLRLAMLADRLDEALLTRVDRLAMAFDSGR